MNNTLIDGLVEKGWCVTDNLIDTATIDDLAEEAAQLWEAGEFKTAAIGSRAIKTIRSDIRGDKIHWLDSQNLSSVQSRYMAIIESLRAELNYSLYLGLQSFEAHFALYQPGAGYKKHLDRFSASDERSISCVLYLNKKWQPTDGGQLRIYLGDDFVDIPPVAGTMVIFRSDILWHEVLPGIKPRWSLTGWYRRRSLRGIAV